MSTCEKLRDAVIHHATGVLCRATGSMASSQLYEQILKNFDVTESYFWSLMQCARFVVKRLGQDGGNSVVVAKTSLRLCKEYWKGSCCEEKCEELHICRYHVYGNCRFGKNEFGKPCKRSHDIRCPHNRAVLQDCTLQDLPEGELFLLLLQNDPSLLPEVCRHYNRSGLAGGGCSLRDGCTNLHLCLHHVQGRCRFGPKCQRLHAVDHGGLKLLERWGLLAGDIIQTLLVVYQNRHHLLLATAAPHAASWEANAARAPTQENLRPPEEFNAIREKRKEAKLRYGSSHPARVKTAEEGRSRSSTDPADAPPPRVSPLGVSDLRHKLSLPVTETDQRTSNDNICLHFLLKRCQFEDQCMLVHFNMPYKWEVLKGGVWRDLRHLEDIELAFCDPEVKKSPGSSPVDFLSMTQGSSRRPVRRLTTPSSVTLPSHHTLTTEWVWYYQDHFHCWVEYGQADSRQRTTSVTSRDLEQAYQKNRFDKVKLMRGFREYLLSFKDMYQWNRQQKTRRRVRRRPRFLSAASVARLTAQ